jgi:hypothetical protein
MHSPFEIFFSYAHEDEELMNDVRRQLIVYERNGRILKWHDRMIPAGAEWRTQIDTRLDDARIILLFMSPHFIESRYCYEVEGQVALEKQKSGQAKVIPIILRPCAWEATPFGEFQALPTDAQPISKWSDRDDASLNVARGIMKVVDELSDSYKKSETKAILTPSNNVSRSIQATKKESGLIYCKRCGHLVGHQNVCTGAFTHHEFKSGKTTDYCERCGVSPGNKTLCTGSYTHHDFVSDESNSVYCVRCGVSKGVQSTCTGAFTYHQFKKL